MPLSWVEIDLAALRHNFERARERLHPETQILGVVKSDAYGHGMIAVAQELASAGASFLAVSKFWEAQDLRKAGIDLPILVLLGIETGELEDAVMMDVRPVLYRLDHAQQLGEIALKLGRLGRFHLKVDTGMGRLGVPLDKLPEFLDRLKTIPSLQMEGLLSHFAAADESDKSYSEYQTAGFQEALRLCGSHGFDVPYAHLSNSAGLLDLPGAHFQLVRPGIMLYGSQPSADLAAPADLRPVMSLKAKILQVKTVPPGQSVGYGRTFITERATTIATLPVGYDDGYPRHLSNRGFVLVSGRRAPVVGRVSMNMITVDVTHIPGVKEDDEVVLLGEQGSQRLTGDEIASLCGTISYEIYCNLGKHRFKYYRNGSCRHNG